MRFGKIRFGKVKKISRNIGIGLKPCGFFESYRLTHLLRPPQSFRSIFLIFFTILLIISGFSLPGSRLIPLRILLFQISGTKIYACGAIFSSYIYRTPSVSLKVLYTLYNKNKLLERFACSSDKTLL
jgi:hypothetical protein